MWSIILLCFMGELHPFWIYLYIRLTLNKILFKLTIKKRNYIINSVQVCLRLGFQSVFLCLEVVILTNNKLYIRMSRTDLWDNSCQKICPLSIHQSADCDYGNCKIKSYYQIYFFRQQLPRQKICLFRMLVIMKWFIVKTVFMITLTYFNNAFNIISFYKLSFIFTIFLLFGMELQRFLLFHEGTMQRLVYHYCQKSS